VEIKSIIESGLMETYVMGIATEEEVQQVLLLKKEYPEFKDALASLELDMEVLAQGMAIAPPPGTLEKVETEIHEIQRRNQVVQKVARPNTKPDGEDSKEEKYIEVEAESNQMRVNKAWKWIFIAVFILGKIFLASAIYFYLENRQAREEIKELKIELKQKIK